MKCDLTIIIIHVTGYVKHAERVDILVVALRIGLHT